MSYIVRVRRLGLDARSICRPHSTNVFLNHAQMDPETV